MIDTELLGYTEDFSELLAYQSEFGLGIVGKRGLGVKEK
jgi:hypothetical protein